MAIPAAWEIATLQDVLSVSREKTDDFSDTTIKYIGLEHMEKDGGIIGCGSVGDVVSTKNVFHPGQVLYGKLRPYLNKHDVATFDGVCSTDILVLQMHSNVLAEYVNYYLNQTDFIEYAVSNSKGINLPRVSGDVILKAPFPLPPLPEQRRIVDRIEILFAKLDEAKEKAQAVVDGFETRKAAILHKAFTGELIGIAGTMVPLEEVVETIRIGPFGSALHQEDYIEGGIPIINPKHIVNQTVAADTRVTINEEKAAELSSYVLQENDVILGRRGEMGRCAPITSKEAGWLCGTGSMIIRLKPEYDATFYAQVISSKASVEYLDTHAVGSTLKNLNEKIVRQLPVPVISANDQRRIANILDSLLSKEQQAHAAALAVIDRIDAMKKAVLAKAFRGELGTNDETEMPAEIEE